MPRRGWNEPRRVNPAVPSEIVKKRRDRGAAGGQAGSAGQGLPLSNPCRSPAAGKMKLPGCRANETFSAPVGAANETFSVPVRAANETFSVPVRAANEALFAQRTKSAPVRPRTLRAFYSLLSYKNFFIICCYQFSFLTSVKPIR